MEVSFIPEGLKQILAQNVPIGALFRIDAASSLTQQRVIEQRRVVHAHARGLDRQSRLADRGNDFRHSIDVHARASLEHARQSGAMGQQVKYRDAITQSPAELRDDLRDRRGQSQQASLDGLEDEDVGKRLGHGEQAEYRIECHLALLCLAAVAKGFEIRRLPAPMYGNHTAEVKSRGNVALDGGAQIAEGSGIEPWMRLHSRLTPIV